MCACVLVKGARRGGALIPRAIDHAARSSALQAGDMDGKEDKYNWRKYGQKNILGTGVPRSYFKCAILGCPAKKQARSPSNCRLDYTRASCIARRAEKCYRGAARC